MKGCARQERSADESLTLILRLYLHRLRLCKLHNPSHRRSSSLIRCRYRAPRIQAVSFSIQRRYRMMSST